MVIRQVACSSSLPDSFRLISAGARVMPGILSSSSDGWLFVMFYDFGGGGQPVPLTGEAGCGEVAGDER